MEPHARQSEQRPGSAPVRERRREARPVEIRPVGTRRALLDGAAAWLSERGRDRMLGPLDFSTNHECGLLIEGHDLMPQILENWRQPYYRELLEQHDMAKAMDLYKWEIMTADRDKLLPI